MHCLGVMAILAATVGASAGPGVWTLRPKYGVGQELTYEGRVREVRSSADVQSESELRLSLRALVLGKSSDGSAEVGCYTATKSSDPKVSKPNSLDDAIDMSFDVVRVLPSGAARWWKEDVTTRKPVPSGRPRIGKDPEASSDIDSIPRSGSPVDYEFGYFLEIPNRPLKSGEKWAVRPEGQPGIACQVLGSESVTGTRCIAISLHQESQNWSSEDRTVPAWCMDAKVWIDEKTKSVFQVDRTTQLQSPGTNGERLTRTVRYTQATGIRYHGELLQRQIEDYRTIRTAFAQLESAAGYATASERETHLSSARQELKLAMQKLYSTPYRSVIEWLDKRAELMASTVREEEEPAIILASRREAAIGEKAPHFVVRNASTGESISRKSTRGAPVLMVFVDPTSDLSLQALETAVSAAHAVAPGDLMFLAVCTEVGDETEAMLKEKVPGDYVVCTGGAADGAYGMEGTPHVVLIDRVGVLRANQMGFGPGMHAAITSGMSSMKVENIATDKKKSFLR